MSNTIIFPNNSTLGVANSKIKSTSLDTSDTKTATLTSNTLSTSSVKSNTITASVDKSTAIELAKKAKAECDEATERANTAAERCEEIEDMADQFLTEVTYEDVIGGLGFVPENTQHRLSNTELEALLK